MFNKNILILVPGKDARGGINNYYFTLRKHLPSNIFYLQRGARNWPNRQNAFFEVWRGITDLIKFFIIIRREKINLVQTTTSLSSLALFRDGLFVIFSKLLNKKVIVFIRGWDYNFAKGLDGTSFSLFKFIFFKADALIELSNDNKQRLLNWGYKKNIYLETTVVDDEIENAATLNIILDKYEIIPEPINILLLSRIEKEKGIYEAIDAFAAIPSSNVKYNLIVAGDGNELINAKKYVIDKKINGVVFLGFVNGQKKIDAYLDAHIYLFPTYSEGMPNSVLEAMACGLPILTTRVGGIPDIFENGKNGYFIDVKNIPDITEKLIKLSNNRKKMLEIGSYNFGYARDNFSAKIVASRIIDIFEEILEK